MKKIIALFLSSLLLAALTIGCKKPEAPKTEAPEQAMPAGEQAMPSGEQAMPAGEQAMPAPEQQEKPAGQGH